MKEKNGKNRAKAHGLGPNPRASLPETRSMKQNLTTHYITNIQFYYISKVLNSETLIACSKSSEWNGPESPRINPN